MLGIAYLCSFAKTLRIYNSSKVHYLATATDPFIPSFHKTKMSMNSGDQGKKRGRSGENFKKRWRTFIKSVFEVHRDYHADVYILLRRKGQTFEFKSTDKAWPLSPEDIVTGPTPDLS